ncbi:MAG: TfoX/Sxy family protein [Pseudomonadota bacterium]
MGASDDFKDFIKDQLAGFGPVSIRRMFGGAGIFADTVMFALIADDTLYFKVDETTEAAFAAEGSKPFTYAKGAKTVALSYWEVPPRLLEEPDELADWARQAHDIARASKKPPRRTKTARKR